MQFRPKLHAIESLKISMQRAASVLGRLVAAEHCRHTASAMPVVTGELLIRALSNAIAENDDAKRERILEQLLSLFPMVEPTLAVPSTHCSCLAESTCPSRGSNANGGYLDIPRWNIGYGREKIDRVEARTESGHASAPAESVWLESGQETSLVRQLRLKKASSQALVYP